jgi:hypothetical protein
MKTIELQNSIIHKVLEIKNEELLKYIYSVLIKENSKEYKLTEFEKALIEESLEDYKSENTSTNDDVFKRNEKWLEK